MLRKDCGEKRENWEKEARVLLEGEFVLQGSLKAANSEGTAMPLRTGIFDVVASTLLMETVAFSSVIISHSSGGAGV
jgi:hypothetical protein